MKADGEYFDTKVLRSYTNALRLRKVVSKEEAKQTLDTAKRMAAARWADFVRRGRL